MHEARRARRRGPTFAVGAGLLAAALLGAACGSSKKDSNATPTTAAGATTSAAGAATSAGGTATTSAAATTAAPSKDKPTPGGVLRVRVEADTDGWIPAKMQCDSACQIRARTFFETLASVTDGDNPEVKPYLAESVDHNADYTEWTIKIRDGITFHDGSKLDATVAAEAIRRAAVTGFSSLAWLNVQGAKQGGKPEEVTGVTVADPMTVKVKTIKPWVTFPYNLTGTFIGSKQWLDKVYANPTQPDLVLGAQPVGTGPFKFKSWKPGDTLVVEKNPNYWRKDADGNALPYLDGIEFKVIADELTAQSGFDAGQFDLMPTDNGENIKKYRAAAKDKKVNLAEQSKFGETFYILMHVGATPPNPLSDQRVRCGLAAATDSKTLAETTGAGVFPVANAPFSPGQQGYLDDPGNQKFDMAKAKDLISQYTKEKGQPTIIYSTVTDQTSLRSAQIIQQAWQAAGVKVDIKQIEQQKLILNALLGDKEFNAFGWRNHAGIVLDNQYFWWHSSAAPPDGAPALNFGRMKDPVIDEKLDAARGEPDLAKQKALAEDVNREFAKQCWIIPTTWTIWGIASQPNVQGVGQSTFPDNTTVLRDGAGFPGQVWFYNMWLKK